MNYCAYFYKVDSFQVHLISLICCPH